MEDNGVVLFSGPQGQEMKFVGYFSSMEEAQGVIESYENSGLFVEVYPVEDDVIYSSEGG